jgi:hypothetical protein
MDRPLNHLGQANYHFVTGPAKACIPRLSLASAMSRYASFSGSGSCLLTRRYIAFDKTLLKGTSKNLERPVEQRMAQALIVLGRQGATKGSYPQVTD